VPFIPHTAAEIEQMLAAIGVQSVDELFAEIPDPLKVTTIADMPAGLTEMELRQLMLLRADQDNYKLNFIGAGSYEHHIPAAVWEIAGRGEYLTSYTPYQAEASQGTLQLLYEYQTMLVRLMATEAANASMYDGASALAEAVLMAVRLSHGKKKQVLMLTTVHPHYRQAVTTLVQSREIEIFNVPYAPESGCVTLTEISAVAGIATETVATAETLASNNIAALVIQQPNFFGGLEDVDNLVNWAHKHNILVIAVVNPMAMALLQPPGVWGDNGADIICGEGQPFGIPMASGGPYCGFMCCKKKYIRQLPGRIVGRTTDTAGRVGYVLTLQAREQHIRRAKANSNICTNQGLLVTAMTLYMSLLGFSGIQAVAKSCHHNTLLLVKLLQKQALENHAGFKLKFNSPYFHEVVLQCPQPVSKIKEHLAQRGIQAGFALGDSYPELADCLLCCVTETKTPADIELFVQELQQI